MRLVDADRLEAKIQERVMLLEKAYGSRDPYAIGVDEGLMYVEDAPTVDAEPVVHGRWITWNKGQNNWCECSNCNTVGSPSWKRCPVCEAKMDGGKE